MLGDLYVRANQVGKAVDQFIRIADSLHEEGFLPKAGALYKKVIKIKPDHDHALMQAAEIAASSGLYADARGYLSAVADKRLASGDKRGHAQMRIRIGNLDPADYESRVTAALARVEINDTAGAVRDLKEIARELGEKNRAPEALHALTEAAALAPEDVEIRGQLLDVHIAAEDFVKARECATTADQFKLLAARLEERGRADEALEALCDAARVDPSDVALRAQLARTFVARGDSATAAEYLTEETAGDDPVLLLAVAGLHLRAGRIEEGVAIGRRLLAEDGGRRDQIAHVGWDVAEQSPEAGYAMVELAADMSVAESDWAHAAAALQEFVTRVPNHIPALMRLVEICVDGSLEATLYSAQAQLADAYITAGMAAEARFISEDLVAREPWERSNIERFRRALVLMNEPDPDALIAARLSGQSPFMSTDLNIEFPPFEPEPSTEAQAEVETPAPAAEAAVETPAEDSEAPIDLNSFIGGLEASEAVLRHGQRVSAKSDTVEVDLSIVLDQNLQNPAAPRAAAPASSAKIAEMDSVFDQLRDETMRRMMMEAAENAYKSAIALQKAGDLDSAISCLQIASQAPALRFATAAQLGRIFKQRGDLPRSIEWLDRAAQASAPTLDEQYQVLYELAEDLESSGDRGRALATCLQLQAQAGSYRDVNERIDRLARVQARE
jgi:tetratricopeptide (TPR) repeat protein